MNYQLTKNNLHIEDSWKVRKRAMKDVLTGICFNDVAQHGAANVSLVWARSDESLISEWVCHNFLYTIGIQRERTRDVDLDYPCDRPEWIYRVLSWLVWPFVR